MHSLVVSGVKFENEKDQPNQFFELEQLGIHRNSCHACYACYAGCQSHSVSREPVQASQQAKKKQNQELQSKQEAMKTVL